MDDYSGAAGLDRPQSGQNWVDLVIPYGKQEIVQADIDAVIEVLTSDFLTQGPTVPAFEHAVSARVGVNYGVAVNSATSALHIACLALDLGPGDILWTSPITFVASANCALYCGASVDFVDIDPRTLNMCPEALKSKLEEASQRNRLPKVLIPVHMCGRPCEMEEVSALAKAYGVKVIEDASHAIGSCYRGSPVGSCKYSDITVFSFHPVKIVTTAEGGMALTNNADLLAKMRLFRSHGVTRDESLMTNPSAGPWYYEQMILGWNYRMTDIQAALGVSQLSRLSDYVTRRNELAARYEQAFRSEALDCPIRDDAHFSSFHLYVVRLQNFKRHRDIFETLRAEGVGVNLHYIPVHLQPFYRQFGFSEGDYPNAEDYYRRAISLPLFPAMTSQQQDTVVERVRSALG